MLHIEISVTTIIIINYGCIVSHFQDIQLQWPEAC